MELAPLDELVGSLHGRCPVEAGRREAILVLREPATLRVGHVDLLGVDVVHDGLEVGRDSHHEEVDCAVLSIVDELRAIHERLHVSQDAVLLGILKLELSIRIVPRSLDATGASHDDKILHPGSGKHLLHANLQFVRVAHHCDDAHPSVLARQSLEQDLEHVIWLTISPINSKVLSHSSSLLKRYYLQSMLFKNTIGKSIIQNKGA